MEFATVFRDVSAMVSAGVPPDLHKLLQLFGCNTYFTLSGCPDVVQYQKGSGAGTPLADLIFSFLMARILKFIDSELLDRGLSFTVTPSNEIFGCHKGSKQCSGSSYIDDTFYFGMISPPLRCLVNARNVASIVIDSFGLHGLETNLKRQN